MAIIFVHSKTQKEKLGNLHYEVFVNGHLIEFTTCYNEAADHRAVPKCECISDKPHPLDQTIWPGGFKEIQGRFPDAKIVGAEDGVASSIRVFDPKKDGEDRLKEIERSYGAPFWLGELAA